MNGIISCDNGQFLCDGIDLLKNRKLREKTIAYVPQSPLLIEELTARDNLLMWYEKSEIDAYLSDGVLKMLGIGDFMKTTVKKMSGGMKKRLSIACAVSNKPRILFLDEPSSALDPICKKAIYDYILRFKASGGIVILATHDLDELSLCDNCYVIKDCTLRRFENTGNFHDLVEKL